MILCRSVLVAVVLSLAPTHAIAQSVRVDRAEIFRTGIFSAKIAKKVEDASISTGQRQLASIDQRVEITAVLPAKVDTFCGLEFVIHGRPKGKSIPVRIVWRYPKPGLANPTGRVVGEDDYKDEVTIAEKEQFFWHLTQNWQ